MKIHHFGLWFRSWSDALDDWAWSTTIPQHDKQVDIYYDGLLLGHHDLFLRLSVIRNHPHIIKLKDHFEYIEGDEKASYYQLGHRLTMDDFEIIENPDCYGDK